MDADTNPIRHRLHAGPVEQPVRYIDVRGLTDASTVLERVDPETDYVGFDRDADDLAVAQHSRRRTIEHAARAERDDDQPDGEHGDIDALRVGYTHRGRPGRRGHTRAAR